MVSTAPIARRSSSCSRERVRRIRGQRRGDEAEVAGLVTQRLDRARDLCAVGAALAQHLRLEEHHVQQREEGEEAEVRQRERAQLGALGGGGGEQLLEAERDDHGDEAHHAPVEGDGEGEHRVDERVEGGAQAAAQLDEDVAAEQQRGAELHVEPRLVPREPHGPATAQRQGGRCGDAQTIEHACADEQDEEDGVAEREGGTVARGRPEEGSARDQPGARAHEQRWHGGARQPARATAQSADPGASHGVAPRVS